MKDEVEFMPQQSTIEAEKTAPPVPITQKLLLRESEKVKLKLLRDLADYTEYEAENLEPKGDEAVIIATFTVARFSYVGKVVKYTVAGKD